MPKTPYPAEPAGNPRACKPFRLYGDFMTWLCKPALRRSLVGACLAVAVAFLTAPTVAHANEWGEFAYVSQTMGVSDSRICIGEASRGEIGCPSYAPTVSDTGTLNVTGGLAVNAVSLSTAGTTWGYLGSGSSYLPNLNAATISVTSLTVNGVSFTGAGASALSGLTDVSASSSANNSLLRYNTTSSKWEAVGLNDAVSTTTMVAGWPDALICTDNGGTPTPTGRQEVFWQFYRESSTTNMHYAWVADTITYSLTFNPDGSYSSKWNSGSQTDTTDCEGKSISQLYASGQAFNFIGNNGTSVSSSTASGYALTSGTLSVTANSVTSVVSLSTAGTTWGYLGSAASYLPQLTAGQVSATNISSTMVQIASATTVVTCDSGHAGALRYNSSSTALELCTGSGWQMMGVGIPAGTISAFASTTCPTGWSEYTPARGRFLRGIDNGAGNDPDGTRAPGSTQVDMFKSHSHGIPNGHNDQAFSSYEGVQTNQSVYNKTESVTDSTGGPETRPKNVAVTYCQFNGTSNGWNNPLSGGSTSAAGSTGQIQYNTSGSFDGNAGLTWTNASQRLTATNISATALTVNGVAITGSASGDRITSGTTSLIANTSGILDANVPLTVSGSVFASGVSTTGPVSASTLHLQNNPVEACSTGNIGAMKVIDGRVFVCRM
jgi:hypothetical protein